jgi:hypothetical protein
MRLRALGMPRAHSCTSKLARTGHSSGCFEISAAGRPRGSSLAPSTAARASESPGRAARPQTSSGPPRPWPRARCACTAGCCSFCARWTRSYVSAAIARLHGLLGGLLLRQLGRLLSVIELRQSALVAVAGDRALVAVDRIALIAHAADDATRLGRGARHGGERAGRRSRGGGFRREGWRAPRTLACHSLYMRRSRPPAAGTTKPPWLTGVSMTRPAGFEPATSSSGGMRSIQLS